MCDYSLEYYASAKAKQGENLTLTGFPSSSKGFTATDGDKSTAVCVLPGTQLVMEMPETIQYLFGVTNEELVTMTTILPPPGCISYLSIESPTGERYLQGHKDAVELSNGTKLLLQWFPVGVKARVAVLAGGKEDRELASQAPRADIEPTPIVNVEFAFI